MSRADCLKWYEGKGFKIPVKSACIGCPFHDDKFWIEMRDQRPKEFASAVEFDKRCVCTILKLKILYIDNVFL